MRNYVEIGIGREARRSYSLSEISLVPSRRTRSSADVDTSWSIDAYNFDIPLVSHPTDALASPEFAIEMGKLGGVGVFNAEGVFARHADAGEIVAHLYREGAGAGAGAGENSGTPWFEFGHTDREITQALQQLHSAPLDHDLLATHIGQIRDSGVTVAVRVSPQNARELAPVVIKAGAEMLFIQGTVISAEYVERGGEPLNLKEFIGSLEVPVITGGVFDYTTAMHLMRSGAAGVIVGSGTSTGSHPVGVPMATAIADVAAARRDYLDETGGRYVHVLADGEIHGSGGIAAAIACGADAVMVGHPLAQACEAAGGGAYWESVVAHPHYPRGSATPPRLNGPRVPLDQVLNGPATDPFGATNLVGGLSRIMAKCGYTDVKSFQKVGLSVQD